MEPLSSANANAFLRPAGGAGEAPSVLREARMVTGEVVARLDGGTLLLGIGGETVPAETGVDLEPGDRFLASVERRDGVLALRLVPLPDAAAEPALVRAVRALAPRDRPLGALLGELAALLSAELEESAAVRELHPGVDAHRFVPDRFEEGEGGGALAPFAGRGGLACGAALLAAAGELGLDDFDAALSNLAARLAPGGGGALLRALGPALRGLGAQPVEGPLTRELLARLADRAARAVAAELGDAGASAFPPETHGALLRALLSTPGAFGPSALAASLAERAFAGLAVDLRGRLALALPDLSPVAREAALGVLATLDLERLLAAARAAGEPLCLAIPVGAGEGWTTAHVLLSPGRALVGLGETGVRADLLFRGERLAVCLRVARPDLARRLRASAAELARSLGGFRAARVTVLDARPDEVDVERLARDVRFLREHPVMDVRG